MKTLREIEALTEALAIVNDAQCRVAMKNSWAFGRLDHTLKYLSKQQAALCEFHFLEHQTIGDARKVEDALAGVQRGR